MGADLRGGAGSGTGPQVACVATPGSSGGRPGRCVVVAAAGPLSDGLDPAGRSDRLRGRELRAVVRILTQDLVWRGPLRRRRADLPGLRRDSAPVVGTEAGQEEGTQAVSLGHGPCRPPPPPASPAATPGR